MRHLLVTCLLCTFLWNINTLVAGAQDSPSTLATARVSQAQGKYVFYYTQPVAPYDVVFSYQARLEPNERMTLNTIIDAGITAATLESGAQLKAFDAIIIQAGSRDLAIKFRDGVAPADRALATVPRNQGKYMYVFCEPVTDYQVVKTEGISWYNHAFGGAYYTLGRVEENLLKTAKKNPQIEGILLGETATYVSFKVASK